MVQIGSLGSQCFCLLVFSKECLKFGHPGLNLCMMRCVSPLLTTDEYDTEQTALKSTLGKQTPEAWHSLQILLCCSCPIAITSTWLPIPFANSTWRFHRDAEALTQAPSHVHLDRLFLQPKTVLEAFTFREMFCQTLTPKYAAMLVTNCRLHDVPSKRRLQKAQSVSLSVNFVPVRGVGQHFLDVFSHFFGAACYSWFTSKFTPESSRLSPTYSHMFVLPVFFTPGGITARNYQTKFLPMATFTQDSKWWYEFLQELTHIRHRFWV